jgi:hypothetical protein
LFSTFCAFPGMSDVLSDRVRDATKAIVLISKRRGRALNNRSDGLLALRSLIQETAVSDFY